MEAGAGIEPAILSWLALFIHGPRCSVFKLTVWLSALSLRSAADLQSSVENRVLPGKSTACLKCNGRELPEMLGEIVRLVISVLSFGHFLTAQPS